MTAETGGAGTVKSAPVSSNGPSDSGILAWWILRRSGGAPAAIPPAASASGGPAYLIDAGLAALP